jgi:ABC-2 type transport system permease protein
MSRPIFKIIKKEVLEMVRDPRLLLGMIIVPLLMFPMMGLTMSASISSIEDTATSIGIGVVNMDDGFRSAELLTFLAARGIIDHYYSYNDIGLMVNGTEYPVDMFILIESGFTESIENNGNATVVLITPLKTYSISESISSDIVSGYIIEYQQAILDERIAAAFPGQDVSSIKSPIIVGSLSVVKGEIVNNTPSEITNQMMVQSLMIPMVLMILLIMAAQLAATSVAMEKEEKTLETLLTTPVPRSTILFGKIAGVVVISAVAVVAYVAGFSFYMSSLMDAESTGIDLASMGLVPSTTGLLVLLATLFLSLVSALSLSVLVASFTEDVRSAQAILGVIYVPILIPAIVLMLVDISQLPGAVQTAMLAIPFTYPVIASKSMYTGDFSLVVFGMIYQIIFTAIIIYVASWFFSSEKIMTARLNLKGSKGLLSKKR